MTTGIAFCDTGAMREPSTKILKHSRWPRDDDGDSILRGGGAGTTKATKKKGGAKYVNSRFRCKTTKIEKQKKEPPQAKFLCCYKGRFSATLFFNVTEEDYVRNL